MLTKKHPLMIGALSAIFTPCSVASWASTPVNQRPAPLHAANESMRIAGQRDASTATGKIDGKVTDTSGLPLPGITIGLQLLNEETTYGSSFEDKAIADEKGKFTIMGYMGERIGNFFSIVTRYSVLMTLLKGVKNEI